MIARDDLPADPEAAAAILEAEYQAAQAGPERLHIAPAAGIELAARFRAVQVAEQRLSDYTMGLSMALGIEMTRIRGFDDATGELLLAPPRSAPADPAA